MVTSVVSGYDCIAPLDTIFYPVNTATTVMSYDNASLNVCPNATR
jgi:hypothetical protein